VTLVFMSNKDGQGVFDVKEKACKILTEFRLGQGTDHIASKTLKKEEEFLRGIYIARPKVPRDNKERPPVIPREILLEGRKKTEKPTLREIQDAMGGAGVFNFPLQEHFKLEDPNWKYDVVPEIVDGKNVWDFYDKDVAERMQQLEKEEEMLMLGEGMEEEDLGLDKELFKAYEEVKSKRALAKLKHKMESKKRISQKNFKLVEVEEGLVKANLPTENVRDRFKGKRRGKRLEELYAETAEHMDVENGDEDETSKLVNKVEKKMRSMSRSRSKGAVKAELTENEKSMVKLKQKIQKEWKNLGISGEADRRVDVKLPKHLYTGKRGIGKSDWR